MTVDWMVVSTIAAPVIAIFVGIALDRFLERRPNLIAYFTHASAFNLPAIATAQAVDVNTHGIVIKNVGKRPATDIRVRHHILPNHFRVFSIIEHRVENLPGGGVEIIFSSLVPNEEVTISYLYFPPLFVGQIHAGIRHSEGFATQVTTLPTPQYPTWLRRALLFLLILGLIALGYLIFEGFIFGMRVADLLRTH